MGTYDQGTLDSMKVYFSTHQPAEYKNNPVYMDMYSQIYGAQAAGLLDYAGVAAENVDPNWTVNNPNVAEKLKRIGPNGEFLNTPFERGMLDPSGKGYAGINIMPGTSMNGMNPTDYMIGVLNGSIDPTAGAQSQYQAPGNLYGNPMDIGRQAWNTPTGGAPPPAGPSAVGGGTASAGSSGGYRAYGDTGASRSGTSGMSGTMGGPVSSIQDWMTTPGFRAGGNTPPPVNTIGNGWQDPGSKPTGPGYPGGGAYGQIPGQNNSPYPGGGGVISSGRDIGLPYPGGGGVISSGRNIGLSTPSGGGGGVSGQIPGGTGAQAPPLYQAGQTNPWMDLFGANAGGRGTSVDPGQQGRAVSNYGGGTATAAGSSVGREPWVPPGNPGTRPDPNVSPQPSVPPGGGTSQGPGLPYTPPPYTPPNYGGPGYQPPGYQPASQYPPSITPYTPTSMEEFWSGQAPGAWQWLQNLLSNGLINNGERMNQSQNSLQNYLNQYSPQSLTDPLIQMLQNMGQPGAAYGNEASNLMGGTYQGAGNPYGGSGNYGLNTMLSQIMNEGLPNQTNVQGMFPWLQNQGQQWQGWTADTMNRLGEGQNLGSNALQNQLQAQLSGQMQGSGLTPEYMSAMRESVLKPQQEGMMGSLNNLAGGNAMLTSPAYQEMLRRNEKDFTNQMVSQGFNNLNNVQGQAANLGAQQFGQGTSLANQYNQFGNDAISKALQVYGIVPESMAPYANLTGNMINNLSGLNQSQQFGQYNAGSNMLNQILGTQSGLNSQMLQQYLGQLQTYGGMTNSLLGNQTQLKQQELANQGQANAARLGSYGQAGAQIAKSIPDIIKIFQGMNGGGGGGGNNEAYANAMSQLKSWIDLNFPGMGDSEGWYKSFP